MSSTFDVENTPLHVASQKEQSPASVRSLVREGADLNAKNKAGWTPLHVAVVEDSYEKAKILLDAGADVNAAIDRQEDDTALHLTAWTNNPKMAQLLIKHGARLDVYGEMGTPLETANHFHANQVADVIRMEMHKREQNYLKRLKNRLNPRRIAFRQRIAKHPLPCRARV